MRRVKFIAASFSQLRDATAAIDWFRNQAISPNAITVAAVPRGAAPRLPQRGDNRRTDLTWIVALDLDAARIPRSVAADALRREGGKLLARVPDLPVEAGATPMKR